MDVVLNWVVEQSLEITSIAIAIVALIYAALAHHETKKAAVATEGSNIVSLRVQAKSGLAEVDRSFLLLQSACRENETLWRRFHRNHSPKLSLYQPKELHEAAIVERDGGNLLRGIKRVFDNVDKLSATQLEGLIQQTKSVAIQIERLSQRLTPPPHLAH